MRTSKLKKQIRDTRGKILQGQKQVRSEKSKMDSYLEKNKKYFLVFPVVGFLVGMFYKKSGDIILAGVKFFGKQKITAVLSKKIR